MKYKIFLVLIFILGSFAQIPSKNSLVDNEFAEFEVSDESATDAEDNFVKITTISEDKEKEEPIVQQKHEEEDEFLTNDDEFEGIEEVEKKTEVEEASSEKKSPELKPLTFTDIPAHFRSNWSSYQVEALALIIIFFYAIIYLYGKSCNHSIAYSWFVNNRDLLENQFALVGDDGLSQEPTGGRLVRETDYSYTVWCSGRAGCQGMLTQIRLIKRQDLVGWTLNLFQPKADRVTHKIVLDKNEIDSFVLIFGNRKSVPKTVKDMWDLSTYTLERKNVEKFGLPSNFSLFYEIAETVPAIIDSTTQLFIKKYEKYIEYFHLSDQYAGAKAQDESVARLPETAPTLIFSFYLQGDEEKENVYPILMNFIFFLVERARRYRLSREGKNKADKKRQSVEEIFLKTTHLQRQEAAQARREEKARERKQRVMEEEDPEKQKRLEKLEQKRDAKLRQPKMKQFKIK